MQLALPSRDYYLKKSSEAALKAYHRYMTSVAVLLGADPQTATKEFEKVIALEKQLANVRSAGGHCGGLTLAALTFQLILRGIRG